MEYLIVSVLCLCYVKRSFAQHETMQYNVPVAMSEIFVCLSLGDSIVVAPSQTLSNEEYHMLRETAIKVRLHILT